MGKNSPEAAGCARCEANRDCYHVVSVMPSVTRTSGQSAHTRATGCRKLPERVLGDAHSESAEK